MLETGKEYRNGHGDRVEIGGPTKDNPEWVYSTSGDWYDRHTGHFLWYDPQTLTHETRPSWRDINLEVPPATPG